MEAATPLDGFVRAHVPFAHDLDRELEDQSRRRERLERAEAVDEALR